VMVEPQIEICQTASTLVPRPCNRRQPCAGHGHTLWRSRGGLAGLLRFLGPSSVTSAEEVHWCRQGWHW
jgi:hypothetical protein